jgi:hypothetical protein
MIVPLASASTKGSNSPLVVIDRRRDNPFLRSDAQRAVSIRSHSEKVQEGLGPVVIIASP